METPTCPSRRPSHRHLGLLLACVTLFATALPASATETLAGLAARIDAHLAQPRFAAADWGIAVVSLQTGRTVYAHNADRLFQPASTAKLYTAALILSTLAPDYRIPTRVLGKPVGRHGEVSGPLILYGMGDPTLGADPTTADWADQLARQLAARGVKRVRGDLIADDTYFSGPPIGSGWEAMDLQLSFAAPASALSVHENRLRVIVTPGAAGDPARLRFEPAAAAPPTRLRLITGEPGTPDDLNLYRAPGGKALHVFGRIAADAPARSFPLAVADPAQAAALELQQALLRQGIRLDGQPRVLHWPEDDASSHADTMVLAEVLSPPLTEILRRGLKRSQNLYLQNLLLLAGVRAQVDAQQGAVPPGYFVNTEAWGIRALRALLKRIGIPPSASLIDEGSGLSRRDLTTPNALVRLLGFLAVSHGDALRAMLPVAGVDGTLARRMRDTPAMANVHAKTGSMTYVHGLAGYVTSAAGEPLAFAILLNNYDPPGGAPGVAADIDAIAVLLATLDQRS